MKEENEFMYIDFSALSVQGKCLKEPEKLTSEVVEEVNCKFLWVCFSNTCNVKCLPHSATTCEHVKEDIKSDVYRDLLHSTVDLDKYFEDSVDLKQLFWKNFKESSLNLRSMFIRGGEVLIQDDLFDLIKFFENNPRPRIKLKIETFLNVPQDVFNQIAYTLESLVNNKCLRSVTFDVKLDSLDQKELDFYRNGLSIDFTKNNLEAINSSFRAIKVNFRVFVHALNISKFKNILFYLNCFFQSPKRFNGSFDRYSVLTVYSKFTLLTVGKLSENLIKNHVLDISDSLNKNDFDILIKDSASYILESLSNQIIVNKDYEIDDVIIFNRSRIDFYVFISTLEQKVSLSFVDIFKNLRGLYLSYREDYFKKKFNHEDRRIKHIKAKLDSVSSTFCLAKWYQVSIHLHNGFTHSCHHPAPHHVPLQEIKDNPSALHNSSYKKIQRKKMLEGERPSECDYCWKVEDLNSNSTSDRYIKSSEEWSAPLFDEAVKGSWDSNVNPRYVEVSFSSKCNLMCTYCHPYISSSIFQEYEKFGEYPHENGNVIFGKEAEQYRKYAADDGPYVKAFWKWLPDFFTELKVLRVTGGEPLLSKNTFKLFKYIENNKNEELELSVNTNLSLPSSLVQKMNDATRSLNQNKSCGNIQIWASIDTHGKRGEYIRHKLNYDLFKSNSIDILESGHLSLLLMITVNVLSISSLYEFVEEVIELKKKYNGKPILYFSYLNTPFHMSIFILPKHYIEYVRKTIELFNSNKDLFVESEVSGLNRIFDLMKKEYSVDVVNKGRADFYRHFSENDLRRGTNLYSVFPEMLNFFYECRKVASVPVSKNYIRNSLKLFFAIVKIKLA